MSESRKFVFMLVILLAFGCGIKNVDAQDSSSVLYVPLIGITSVPEPLSLPKGLGIVTYKYAVKNFLLEVALRDVQVVDNKCNDVKFVEGDDDGNSLLDFGETWRYRCSTKISETTQSIATATGTANNLTATHKAYATVVVGSDTPPPLVSIINVTKVAYPLSLPSVGGDITFTYKVNNPGLVPLSNVFVTDDKCRAMSSKLGDTNNNQLLDIEEVWIYRCTTHLKETTTNTVNVTAFANGLEAVGYATITVKVANSESSPGLPDTGTNFNVKIIIWGILSGVLAVLTVYFFLNRKHNLHK